MDSQCQGLSRTVGSVLRDVPLSEGTSDVTTVPGRGSGKVLATCIRIAFLVALTVLTTRPAAAQERGAQLVTGASLASLGVYAAFADRDCGEHPQTVLQNGRCAWRNVGGRFVGVPPDLPKVQVAGGLAAAGIGGLMASGAWAPSRTIDALFTAGAGVMLLAVARNETHVPGTVHIEAQGQRFTLCPHGYESYGADFDLPECRHTSFNRLNAMWAGIATLGLAAGRWLWRNEPRPGLNVEVRSSAVKVSKTIEF